MSFKNYEEAIDFIEQKSQFSFEESYALASFSNKLYIENEHDGRDLIIRILDKWEGFHEGCKTFLNDLIEIYGLYPYVDDKLLTGSSSLRYELHKSPFLKDVYLHEEQFEISAALQSDKSVVLSAPTSFGKSLLIEEVIASKKYENIVIIQPTLALLDETRKKLSKYKDDYKIIVSTSQEPSNGGNIFLFTGERVVEYNMFPQIDFFIIDEFYKLSLKREDDRAITLNSALHKLLKHTNKFYMLGPMIKEIPIEFKQKYDLLWFPSDFRTVAVDEISFEVEGNLKAKEKEEKKKENLFGLLNQTDEPTLIYCSSPKKATDLAIEFVNFIKENKAYYSSEKENATTIEWLNENINNNWFLIDGLKQFVAIHHGAIPRHLGSTIVDLFNNGSIKYLFCTSTLIEGVNTSAKNVILFDKKKGTKDIDFFDYKNIAGRSGRMNNYFIGNVYRFEKKPDQLELDVDIPIFSQDDAPLEILINLDQEELKQTSKDRLLQFDEFDEEFKEILRRNSSLPLEGQINILREIENNIGKYVNDLNWNFPTYENLKTVLRLCWNNLIKKGDNKAGIRSSDQLAVLTIKYANYKSVKGIIDELIKEEYWIKEIPNELDRINFMSYYALNITRHWFDYKLPKWISVINDIQHYVFSKNGLPYGNYTFYASQLENGFLPKNLAALLEYDVPHSAILKIQKTLKNKDISTENLITNFQREDALPRLKEIGLIQYEIDKVKSIK
jgi:late competence protein required for DNA uptake (superfamily II DNA/RNA helicase)